MAKTNLRTERISVRCTKEIFDSMKDLSDKLNGSDADIIEMALKLLKRYVEREVKKV